MSCDIWGETTVTRGVACWAAGGCKRVCGCFESGMSEGESAREHGRPPVHGRGNRPAPLSSTET